MKISFDPKKVSIFYAILSIITTCSISFFEESLLFTKSLSYNNSLHSAKPLIENYSTILDFLILNPLAIYFLSLIHI